MHHDARNTNFAIPCLFNCTMIRGLVSHINMCVACTRSLGIGVIRPDMALPSLDTVLLHHLSRFCTLQPSRMLIPPLRSEASACSYWYRLKMTCSGSLYPAANRQPLYYHLGRHSDLGCVQSDRLTGAIVPELVMLFRFSTPLDLAEALSYQKLRHSFGPCEATGSRRYLQFNTNTQWTP